MKWLVVKLLETEFAKENIGIQFGETDWYEYETLKQCKTKEEAEKEMFLYSKQLNIPVVNY